MNWWTKALYDTCSLITLDKIILIEPDAASHFDELLALDATFSLDQMRPERVERMRPISTIQELPTLSEMASVFGSLSLSAALSEVDRLVLVTAVHFDLPVVTADKRLARSLAGQGKQVGNVALILKELVNKRRLTQRRCSEILRSLADDDECLLGQMSPDWKSLKDYTFPD